MNTATIEEQFGDAIEEAGIPRPPTIIADGKLHKFPTNGDPKDDAGRYVLHLDGLPAGYFKNWRTDIERSWCLKSERTLTKEERDQFRKRIEVAKQQQAEEALRRHAEAAEGAKTIRDAAKPAPLNHPYLQRKKIKAHSALLSVNGELLISIMIDGVLSSLQFISADGGKRFLVNGAVTGGSHTFGDTTNAKVILVCEGFATGAALHESTGLPVVIAFSAGNLLPVARAIRKQHPTAKIVICGDRDASGVGQRAADEAAKEIDGSTALPECEGTDWNDVFVQQGGGVVLAAIDRALDNYDRYTVEDLEGGYRITFVSYGIALHFQRMSENARGVHGELTVNYEQADILADTDISLKSEASRKGIARDLQDAVPSITWKKVLAVACAEVLKQFRHGDPIVKLEPADSVHVPFIVNPIVYRNHQTLVFAPGGSFKSYLALYFALVAIAGARQSGIAAIRTNVLCLDWELDGETVGARLKALHMGHPELAHCAPFYRRCMQPLHLEAYQIAAEVARLDVGLVIVDSAAMATGGDLNSPESAIKLQQALRRIGCASIVLAHTSKGSQEGQDKSTYGTVFFRELARNVWELSRPENSPRVILSQAGTGCKNSFGPNHTPLGFEFSFQSDRVRITSFDPATEEEGAFEDKLPALQRICRFMQPGKAYQAEDIAAALRIPLATVKSELSRGKRDGLFIRTGSYHNGAWSLATPSNQSLQSIVAAPINAASLQSMLPGYGKQGNSLKNNGKTIVAGIDASRCSQSLLQQGGTISTPSATITDSLINDHYGDPSPEEIEL